MYKSGDSMQHQQHPDEQVASTHACKLHHHGQLCHSPAEMMQVDSDSVVPFLTNLRSHTVLKARQCSDVIQALQQRSHLSLSEKRRAAASVKQANATPDLAEHLQLAALTDAYLAGVHISIVALRMHDSQDHKA